MQPVRKRTAVLVVHGMGLQRPLETVRGVVKAVWLSGDPKDANNKIWMHPERSGIDIDLPVIATSPIPNAEPLRSVDFHELYWSHLMSETRALAVLLWLFELVRKGPRLKPNMTLLWWVGALFLVSTIFAASFLALKLVERLSGLGEHHERIVLVPFLALFIFSFTATAAFALYRAWRFAAWSAVFAVALGVVSYSTRIGYVVHPDFAGLFLPTILAFVATSFLMGEWGMCAFCVAYGLSVLFELCAQIFGDKPDWVAILVPGAMNLTPNVVASCAIIGAYVIVSALFLQPYLGDAARYFRNTPSNVAVRRQIRREAVNTLEGLHLSGRYDRIVVVAHSLGSVIAYDMLRAYFGRVARRLPTTGCGLDEKIDEFERIANESKSAPPNAQTLRKLGREVACGIVRIVNQELKDKMHTVRSESPSAAEDIDADTNHSVWLVTDFVTLGSPLTHAHYLMCEGKAAEDLAKDFGRRVKEREFPTCPPTCTDGDGALTFRRGAPLDQSGRPRWFHNGALFGLTRWTNLYFPVTELFRGDPIGGPLGEIFGSGIFDIALSGQSRRDSGVSAHIRYWDVPDESPLQEAHIIALRIAIDLTDEGYANLEDNFAASQGLQQQLNADGVSGIPGRSVPPESSPQVTTS